MRDASQPLFTQENYDFLVSRMEHGNLVDAGRTIIDTILSRLRQRRETADLIDKYEQLAKQSRSYDETLYNDLYFQLEAILPADFLDHFSVADLEGSGRHLKSLAIRCERAYHNPHKDLEKRQKFIIYQHNRERFKEKFRELSPDCQAKIDNYKQMVAELRISLFSPEIKTLISVSEKKLARAWEELISEC